MENERLPYGSGRRSTNFGPLAELFSVKLAFSDEAVTLQAVELKASELADEVTLTAPERVRLALEGGPAYPLGDYRNHGHTAQEGQERTHEVA